MDFIKYFHLFIQIYQPVPFDEVPLWLKYLAILGFWLFGFGYIEGYIIFSFIDENELYIYDECTKCTFNYFAIIISLVLFVAFEIIFSSLITPFILICFAYHHNFERLLYFFGLGD